AMARTPQPASQAAPLTGELSSCNNTNYANISPAQGRCREATEGFRKNILETPPLVGLIKNRSGASEKNCAKKKSFVASQVKYEVYFCFLKIK
ncbi:MAG: hypothetical protein ACLFSQ_12225, partial [Candidatus Zixiibacteriota bacterium]